jgi:Ca2+-binding RTX toxin-like protein
MWVFGDMACDSLRGGEGSDVIRGFGGNDRLWGGLGNDVLRGGRGDDVLIGGVGQDVLKGGRGADVFEFAAGDGLGAGDHILDFSTGDHLKFFHISPRTVSQRLNDAGTLEVYYGALGGVTEFSNKITIDNCHHLLAAADFLFA